MRRTLITIILLAIIAVPSLAAATQPRGILGHASRIIPNLTSLSRSNLVITGKVISKEDVDTNWGEHSRKGTIYEIKLDTVEKNALPTAYKPGETHKFMAISHEVLDVGQSYMLYMSDFGKDRQGRTIWGLMGEGHGVFKIEDTDGVKTIVNRYQNRGLMNGVEEDTQNLQRDAGDTPETRLDTTDEDTIRVVQGPIELKRVITVINKVDIMKRNIEIIKRSINVIPPAQVREVKPEAVAPEKFIEKYVPVRSGGSR